MADVLDLIDGWDPDYIARHIAKGVLEARHAFDQSTGGFILNASSVDEFHARMRFAEDEINRCADAVRIDPDDLRTSIAQTWAKDKGHDADVIDFGGNSKLICPDEDGDGETGKKDDEDCFVTDDEKKKSAGFLPTEPEAVDDEEDEEEGVTLEEGRAPLTSLWSASKPGELQEYLTGYVVAHGIDDPAAVGGDLDYLSDQTGVSAVTLWDEVSRAAALIRSARSGARMVATGRSMVAGADARIVSPVAASVFLGIEAGTLAHPGSGYSELGASYDYEVEGLAGEWMLTGDWQEVE